MRFRADLHIHSVLSPCGSLEMSPSDIVRAALERKLDIIAVSDHNCVKNLEAFRDAARGRIDVLFGAEVQTMSETHILTLFGELSEARAFGEIIYEHLPDVKNDPEFFGDQVIVDADESILGFEEKMLIQSIDMEIEEVIARTHEFNGLAFFSHIDRDSFSVLSQLGFIPPGTMADGAEISAAMTLREARERFPEYAGMPFITNSDAHYIKDIGSAYTEFLMESVSVAEIRKALRNEDGRSIIYDA